MNVELPDLISPVPDLTYDPHMECMRCSHWNFEHDETADPPGCQHIERTLSRMYFRCDCQAFDDVPF